MLEAGADANYDNGRLVWQSLVRERSEEIELLPAHGAPLHLRTAAGLNVMDRLPTFFDDDGKLKEGPVDLYRPNDDTTKAWTDQDRLNEALSYASRFGHLEAAALLLDRGADINVTAPPLGR